MKLIMWDKLWYNFLTTKYYDTFYSDDYEHTCLKSHFQVYKEQVDKKA